ncbi:hypothetical protein [Acinetobacter vivianii]|uniref:hypothetical protein n=1 Tax=Acinetobacter vivianii TaxID=1776742 RepID=UPI004041EF45
MSESNEDLQQPASEHLGPISRIERIGRGLYGDSWQAQIARDLKNQDGDSISRKTVQSWHTRDNLPSWATHQLLILAKKRAVEVSKTIEFLAEQNTH